MHCAPFVVIERVVERDERVGVAGEFGARSPKTNRTCHEIVPPHESWARAFVKVTHGQPVYVCGAVRSARAKVTYKRPPLADWTASPR